MKMTNLVNVNMMGTSDLYVSHLLTYPANHRQVFPAALFNQLVYQNVVQKCCFIIVCLAQDIITKFCNYVTHYV